MKGLGSVGIEDGRSPRRSSRLSSFTGIVRFVEDFSFRRVRERVDSQRMMTEPM
jgi:hypothetical protein